jgi:hypothetical protein
MKPHLLLIASCLPLLSGCVQQANSDKQEIQALREKVDALGKETGEFKREQVRTDAEFLGLMVVHDDQISNIEFAAASPLWMKDPHRIWMALSNLDNHIDRVESNSLPKLH